MIEEIELLIAAVQDAQLETGDELIVRQDGEWVSVTDWLDEIKDLAVLNVLVG